MGSSYDYFINADLKDYVGEWICIADGKLVSHSKNIKEGYEKAKKEHPNKIISIARVPSEMNCIF